ncbi:MAG: DivIVA domain-containing protein [Ruminococcus sp.]|nr:DivIVA domain-containing protein [Ruminococcus sp.]
MITANDINTKRFEQARPGYKPEEVDEFLQQIAGQIGEMTREREDTQKKIEVLVESVRRYKSDEEALKDAMIGAQKQGKAVIAEAQFKAENLIAEAQQKAEQIISAANVKADEIAGSAAVRAQREREALSRMQSAVTSFKSDLLAMYKSHLELITSLPESDDEEMQEYPQETENTAVHEDMDATRVIGSGAE